MMSGQLSTHFSIIEPDTPKAREAAMKLAFSDLKLGAHITYHVEMDGNGKPHVHASDKTHIGYSLSKAHLKPRKIAVQAIRLGEDVGVDIEYWPKQAADAAFLETISSKADHRALELLRCTGHDAGVALWVIKEAALKFTGKVMVDPREVIVTPKGNSCFLVTSNFAQLQTEVSVLILNTIAEPDLVFILGLAQLSADNQPDDFRKLPFLRAFGWDLAYYSGC